uniref:Ubiquitin interaction motif-containing protein 1 n=1 Tax=Hucho hucho TaxID=62062 RepID=A0A4W5NHX5_9TELE
MSVAVSLQADSPTHPHSESPLGAGSPTQQCQNSPPEGESSVQPPRRKLSYPNHGVADREGARGGGVRVGVAPSERRGKKEGSPLLDMPDLSQTQKVYSQSSPLKQASTSVPLPSSPEEGSSQRNLFGDRSANAVESQDYNNSTKNFSKSKLRIKSPGFPSTTAPQASKPVLCLEKLSQDLLVDCQASGFLLKGHPSLTLPTKSQKSQSYQPKSPTFSNNPVFSKTERGVEPGQSSPSFPKRAMFSISDSGEEEKEASPTVPKSLVFFKTNRGKAEEQGSPTSPKSTMFSKTERGPEEKETFSGSPVFPRTDQIRDQGPQSCVERVSTTGYYEVGDREDAVKSRDASECLPPRPRTTLSLNKRFVPIRKTAGVSDKVVDQEEREGESSQRTVNRISTPAKLAAEEDFNSEELTLALETQPMHELTSNMALRWSDEEENAPAKSAHSPSPVFPQENDLPQPSNQGLSPNTHHHCSTQHRHSPCLVPKKRTHTFEGAVCEEGESQSKCIRKKFTFKGMYRAPSPSLLRQAAGRGSQDEAKAGSPSFHQPQASSSRLSPPTDDQGDGGVVRYYWGVPFCPRGQNPDAYTQVIMSQLEVYEKSLKEAQRGLLRKAGWGEPVLPGPPEKPFSRRGRLERRRAPQLLEEERGGQCQEELVEVVEDDDEEGETRKRQRSRRGAEEGRGGGRQEWKDCQDLFVSSPEQEEKSPSPVFHADTNQLILLPRRLSLRREGERLAEKQPPDLPEEREEDEKEEKRDDKEDGEKREEEEGMGDEEVDVGSLEVPETQLRDDGTQDLMVTSPAQPQPESQSLPQIQTFLSSPRPLEQREEGMLVVGEEEGQRSGPVGIPAVGEDVRMEEDIPEPAFPRSPSPSMDCPICMRLFPLTVIEMHAAYCDGTTGIVEEEMAESHSQVSFKARRKRTRRGEIIGEEQPSSSGSGKVVQGEKCFLCQQLFPLTDHEKHVEDCSKAAPRDGQSGDLLSALDQTA